MATGLGPFPARPSQPSPLGPQPRLAPGLSAAWPFLSSDPPGLAPRPLQNLFPLLLPEAFGTTILKTANPFQDSLSHLPWLHLFSAVFVAIKYAVHVTGLLCFPLLQSVTGRLPAVLPPPWDRLGTCRCP